MVQTDIIDTSIRLEALCYAQIVNIVRSQTTEIPSKRVPTGLPKMKSRGLEFAYQLLDTCCVLELQVSTQKQFAEKWCKLNQ